MSETIARVIEREPDWNALAKVAPRSVVRVVQRCLQKDPQNRIRDIGDVRLELRDALSATEKEAAAPDAIPIGRRGLVALMVASLAAGFLLGCSAHDGCPASPVRPRRTAEPVHRSTIEHRDQPARGCVTGARFGGGQRRLRLDAARYLSRRPNAGLRGIVGGTVRLFARQLDNFDVQPLAGTEGALHPFFSPDGRSVGFLTNDKVKTYSFTTGTTSTICDVSVGVVGTWTARRSAVLRLR